MGSSGVVDLENQQTPEGIDRGGSWLTSLFNRIWQFLVEPSSTDDESEELRLPRTTHLSSASSDHAEEVRLSVEVQEGDSTTSSAPISDKVNANGRDDITIPYRNIVTYTLLKFGGILKGIAEALHRYLHNNGIPGNDQEFRAVVTVTQAPTPSFFKLLLESCFNWTVFLLLVCVILSIVFGIQQEGPSNGWLEGAVGMFAINILVFVPTLIKYFSVPHTRNTSQMEVKVCRGENLIDVSPLDVVPGDIVCLEPGSIVPADGLFISPGESLELEDGTKLPTVDESNPSLVYGAKVVNGKGLMRVTCVGAMTTLGELLGKVRCTPNLQDQFPAQLDNLSTKLQNIGLLVTIVLTLALIIRSVVLKDNEYPGFQADQLKGKTTASEQLIDVIGRFFMKSSGRISVLATYLPLLIVGLSEGVPFSVALAIAYWTKATLSGKGAIAKRNLACFAMGFVSTLCIGGGLTLNPVLEVDVSYDGNQIIEAERVAGINKHVREALYKGIAAPLMMPSSPCSSTEHQLLLPWAKSNLGLDNENLLRSCTIEESENSSTDEEASRVLMKDSETGDMCLYWSGPAATILPKCSEYYDNNGTTKLMDEQKKREFEESIRNMQYKHFNTIAFAHKKIDALMPEEDKSLILIALLGVKDCTGTLKALEVLRKAGVDMIDFPKDDESVMSEGESPIYGMGGPSDKLHTVQRLKDKGHVVAMVGTKTNETPAIKEADVGIGIGTSISEMVGEGSDLVIQCCRLSFLVNIIRNGRCIHYNIQKYIQVELTTNISLLVTILVTTSLGHCAIGEIAALWATTLVKVCGLALLFEPPTEELMEKTPIKQTDSLISKHMWRNILLQALYQVSILAALQFNWKALPGMNQKIMESAVFNSYVLCQVFNLVSSREPEKKFFFRDILRSPWLWVAVGIISITMQVAFIEIAHKVAGNARLDWGQWGVCLLLAMGSWLSDLAGKCVWGFFVKSRITIGSDIGSTSMSSAAASESASSRELLTSTQAH